MAIAIKKVGLLGSNGYSVFRQNGPRETGISNGGLPLSVRYFFKYQYIHIVGTHHFSQGNREIDLMVDSPCWIC